LYFALGKPGEHPLASVLPTLIRVAETARKKSAASVQEDQTEISSPTQL
jgi:hypothetical protein